MVEKLIGALLHSIVQSTSEKELALIEKKLKMLEPWRDQ